MLARCSLALAVFAACNKPDAVTSSPPIVQAPLEKPAANHRGTPTQDVRNLASKMTYEAEHRPKTGVTAERIFEALDGIGLAVGERRQYMGATMHASFCAGGITADKVVVAMCEYADAKSARDGLAFMNARFGGDARQRRDVHGNAVLTVIDPDPRDPRMGKAFTAFFAL